MNHDYTPKVFTRDEPCTKIDIWHAFANEFGKLGFRRRVIDVRTVIGINTPKYLLREEYIGHFTVAGVDYYALTETGEKWLTEGLLRYLEMHPDKAYLLKSFPPGFTWNAKIHGTPQALAAKKPQLIRRTHRKTG